MPLFIVNKCATSNVLFNNGTLEVKRGDAIVIHPDVAKSVEIFEATQRGWVEIVEADSKDQLELFKPGAPVILEGVAATFKGFTADELETPTEVTEVAEAAEVAEVAGATEAAPATKSTRAKK